MTLSRSLLVAAAMALATSHDGLIAHAGAEGAPAPSTRWAPLVPPARGPGGRTSASAAYDSKRDKLVIYGGADSVYRPDVWALRMDGGGGWLRITPGGPVPLRRTMHTMIYNERDDQLVVFGGLYDWFLNDMTVLSMTVTPWWFPDPGYGTPPSARGGHAAIYDPLRHRMLVIGGFGRTLHNDVWEYAPPNVGTWRELMVSGAPMPPRAQHAAVYDPVRDRVVVLGGDGGMFLNDVWALNLGPTPGWERLAPGGAPPSARREHSAIYDPIGDRIIVYGGFDGTACADVWALSLAGAPAWSRPMVAGRTPAGRYGHAAVYDPSRRRMIVYGGTLEGNRIAQEMWALELSSPTAVQAALEEVELGPRRVRLIWSGERLGSAYARLYRADGEEAPWVELGTPGVETEDRLRFEDRSVEPGRRYGYRLLVSMEGGAHGPIDTWVTVPERASLELIGASPNPAAGELHVGFSLADDGAARLELFDLVGRKVGSREVGHMGAGWHRVPLAGGERLPAGVYLVRLTQRGRVLQAKALVVR